VRTEPHGQVSTHRPRRIIVQYDATASSTTDGSITAWATPKTLCEAWTVEWKTAGGRVQYLADQPRPDDSAVIRIRWRSDVTPTPAHRIKVVGGNGLTRYYGINAVIDVNGQHQYWDLYVVEKAI